MKGANFASNIRASVNPHFLNWLTCKCQSSLFKLVDRDWFSGMQVSPITALIRNLAERDELQAQELSLKTLCRIEGDKDIVQLRLQKALKAEKDPQKQARLRSALKMLWEMK